MAWFYLFISGLAEVGWAIGMAGLVPAIPLRNGKTLPYAGCAGQARA